MKMKNFNILYLLIILSVFFITCEERAWDNPHDSRSTLTPDEWAPEGFVIEQVNIHTARLTWHQFEENIDGFQIDKKVGNNDWIENFETIEIDTNTIYTFTDTELIPDTNLVHQYRIFAYAHEEKSVTKDTSVTPVFPPPSEFMLELLSIDNINLTWKDNSDGEEGFKIDRKIGDNDWEQEYVVLSENTTTFLDSSAVPNQKNTYRVYAYKGDNNSRQVYTSTDITFPAPSNMLSEQLSVSKIQLTWEDNSLGEDGFVLDRKRDEEDWQSAYQTFPPNTTTFIDNAILPDETYSYRLHAFNASQNSDTISTTVTTIFPAPTDISSEFVSDKAIVLQWTDNSTDEAGFKIDRKTDDGEWETEYATVSENSTTWTDPEPVYGMTNYYRVYAFIENKNSASIETSEFNIIEPPTNLQALLQDDEHITLTWEDNCHFESHYVIERDQGSGYAEIASIDANQTEYTDNTLTYSETYQYRVKAKTDFNSSAYTSESLPVKVIISPPYNLSYSKIDEFSLELTWNDTCHFESGFKIERDDGSGFTEIATVNADQHNYTDNDVVIDVDYKYRVYTFTTKNQSVKTENMHVVLPPDGFSYVRGNTFQMGDIWHIGDEDEFPIRFVTLPDFYMGQYEITHADYIEFLNSVEVDEDGYKDGNLLIDLNDIDCAVEWDGMEFFFNKTTKVSTINSAVIEITWYGAVEYCNWLSEINGKQTAYTIDGENVICDWEVLGYRLPTEAEWEFAARAGGRNDQKYSGTDFDSEVDDYAVYYQNSGGRVNDVGTKLPNSLGIYDMSGNVWEWCWDWHAGYLSTNPYFPTGPADGDYKVRRGGSWSYGFYYCRTSNRGSNSPAISNDFIGFRVCLPRE